MSAEKCPSAQQLIDLCIGKLPDDEVAAVSDHVEQCVACRGCVEALERIPIPFVGYYLGELPSNHQGFSTEPRLQQVLAVVKQLGRPKDSSAEGA